VCLTVRLLEASAGTTTSELLGLAATRISDQESLVIGLEDLLDLSLCSLIDDCTNQNNTIKSASSSEDVLHAVKHVVANRALEPKHTLLVVSNESLGDGLADG
jgi:hypothetical protein